MAIRPFPSPFRVHFTFCTAPVLWIIEWSHRHVQFLHTSPAQDTFLCSYCMLHCFCSVNVKWPQRFISPIEFCYYHAPKQFSGSSKQINCILFLKHITNDVLTPLMLYTIITFIWQRTVIRRWITLITIHHFVHPLGQNWNKLLQLQSETHSWHTSTWWADTI